MKKKGLSVLVSLASILALASCNFDFNIDGSAYHVEVDSNGNVIINYSAVAGSDSTVSSNSVAPSISVKDGETSLKDIYDKHEESANIACSVVVVKKTAFNDGNQICLLVSDGYSYGTVMAGSNLADFANINENAYLSIKGTVAVFNDRNLKWVYIAASSITPYGAQEKAPTISRDPTATYFDKDGKLGDLVKPYLTDNTYSMPTQRIKVKGLTFDLSNGTGNGDFGHFTFPGTTYTGIVTNDNPSIPNDGKTYSAEMYIYQGIKNTDGQSDTVQVFVDKVYQEEDTPKLTGGFMDLINAKPADGTEVDLSGALTARGNNMGYGVLSDGTSQVFLVDRVNQESGNNMFTGIELLTYIEVKGNVVYDVFQNMLAIVVSSIHKLDGYGPTIALGQNDGAEVKKNPIDIAVSQQSPALYSFNDGIGLKDANGNSMIAKGGDSSLRIMMKCASALQEKAYYYNMTGYFGLSTMGWVIFIPSYVEKRIEVEKITGMTYSNVSIQAGGSYALSNGFTGCNGWIDGIVLRYLGAYSAEFLDGSNFDASGAEILQYNATGNYFIALKAGTVKMKIHYKYTDGTEIISNKFAITVTQ